MTNNFQEEAKKYMDKGWDIIPLNPKGKTPLKGWKWSKDKLTEKNISEISANANIGVALGQRSGGLVDIDFDIPEAGRVGQQVFGRLPGFGRESSPHGHRVAVCVNAQKTKQFELTPQEAELLNWPQGEKLTIIELRGDGAYTMVPPSIHPSGESIQWHKGTTETIPKCDWEDLLKRVSLTAFLAIVVKAYPTHSGSRDNICLALAGALLRAGIAPEQVDSIIKFIAAEKGDEEADCRGKAQQTSEKIKSEENVWGLPKLCELLGIEALHDKMHKWLYGSSTDLPSDLDAQIEELNKRFFVVENDGSKCRVGFFESHLIGPNEERRVLMFQAFEDFKKRYMNVRVQTGIYNGKPVTAPLGKAWLEHPNRRQYEQVQFVPGGTVPDNVLNLWQGFAYEPRQGSCQKMLRHIWHVLAQRDKKAFRYIVSWAAWSVQNPGKPAEVALVFRGGKGTGKGTFCRWVKNLFGHHGLHIFSSKLISGQFNAHLRDCVFLFADEAIAPNNKEAEGILKGILTEPTIAIEGKGKDVVQAQNCLHIMMASNSEWVIPASHDERRFAMFDVSDKFVGNREWFAEIDNEMKNGGAEALLWFLQNLDLGKWHPRESIPNNTALNDQRINSLMDGDKVWFHWLHTGETEVGEARGIHIHISTKGFAKTAKISPKAAGDYLRKMGCQKDKNSRPRGWIAPPLGEARKIWDKQRFLIDWDDTGQWQDVPPPDHGIF